jgi:translocation and assembly module TamB
VTVGTALTSVTGMGSGINPLLKVQKTLGLDRLAVSGGTPGSSATGTQQNPGATLEAGRYVGNNVFVAARQSTTGVTQLVVDVDLSRGLKVRTRLGNGSTTAQGVTPENDPGSSIGISYQFQY